MEERARVVEQSRGLHRGLFLTVSRRRAAATDKQTSLLCGAATLANMFVAIISPLRRVCTVPLLLREECGKREDNIYLTVGLKLILN